MKESKGLPVPKRFRRSARSVESDAASAPACWTSDARTESSLFIARILFRLWLEYFSICQSVRPFSQLCLFVSALPSPL
jgi:hypothetical protein